jgi:Fe-S cluster biogenesis protein NfuA
MTQDAITIQPESTPNPNSVKFNVSTQLVKGGGYSFASADQCVQAPLAAALFEVPGVNEVYIGQDFVTVTAGSPEQRSGLQDRIMATIQAHLSAGKPVITPGGSAKPDASAGASDTEKGIIEIINNEIRPAVARDGGDIVFVAYENNVVKLQLRGACAGCPGAQMTLKMGVEQRLKRSFPEIDHVEPVQ